MKAEAFLLFNAKKKKTEQHHLHKVKRHAVGFVFSTTSAPSHLSRSYSFFPSVILSLRPNP